MRGRTSGPTKIDGGMKKIQEEGRGGAEPERKIERQCAQGEKGGGRRNGLSKKHAKKMERKIIFREERKWSSGKLQEKGEMRGRQNKTF